MVGKETIDSVDQEPVTSSEQESAPDNIPSEEEIEGMFSDVDKDEAEEKIIRNKDARNWSLTHLAHRGMMMDKIMRQNKIVENTVKGLQNESGIDTENLDEEDMGVNIGNESTTKNYYVEQAAPAPPPQLPPQIIMPEPKAPEPQKTNWLPASILAAGALTGAGLLYSKDNPEPTVPPAQPPAVVKPEADYDIGVGFGTPTPIIQKAQGSQPDPTLQPLTDNQAK